MRDSDFLTIFALLSKESPKRIGLWCNGSTRHFGRLSLGSKPGSPTIHDLRRGFTPAEFFFAPAGRAGNLKPAPTGSTGEECSKDVCRRRAGGRTRHRGQPYSRIVKGPAEMCKHTKGRCRHGYMPQSISPVDTTPGAFRNYNLHAQRISST